MLGMNAYRVWVDSYEPCVTFARNRRAAKWSAVKGMRDAGYYLARGESLQPKFPKRLKVRRAPEYDGAPLEEHVKKLRRTYQEEYVRSLFHAKRPYFSVKVEKGEFVVVDRYGKDVRVGK
jgi:hypothetical protein